MSEQEVTLITAQAEFVATGIIPIYRPAPDWLRWQDRIFKRLDDFTYIESAVVAVEKTKA